MQSFLSGTVPIAYVDVAPTTADRGEPILLIHGFASSHATNWLHTQWIKTLAHAGVLMQLALGMLFKRVQAWPRLCRVATLAAASIPLNLASLMIEALAGAPGDLYLDNIVVLERP